MGRRRIVLLDDDPDDRELFCEAVAEIDGHIVCNAFGFWKDAIEDITKNSGIPSLIFLDINMPGKSGWDFLVFLKTNDSFKGIPVIMYSTSSHQTDVDKAVLLGAECLITKPSGYKDLKNVLSGII